MSDELSLERTSAGFAPGFEGSVGVWWTGALGSCGWINGGVKDKSGLTQFLCVDLSV